MERVALSLLLLVACAESQPSSTTTGAGGAGGSSASSPAATTSATGGGSGATGGAGGEGGEGGCPAIFIDDGMPASCATAGTVSLPLSDTSICPADSAVFWPAKVYEVAVNAGDCLHMQADNVGSPLGADLFGAIVEPGGTSVLLDEEIPCTVDNPDGYACPAGGATMAVAGTAYVMVGMWEGAGCTPTELVPFELAVAVNGVDVDLTGAEVCAGDLQEIIP